VDAHVAKALRSAEEAQLLRDEMLAIQARVDTALTTYETVRSEPVIVESDKSVPGGGPTNVRVTIQKTKQELVDTFNFRLAQQRAQTSTLQCTYHVMSRGMMPQVSSGRTDVCVLPLQRLYTASGNTSHQMRAWTC
jgi:hypothetical protein